MSNTPDKLEYKYFNLKELCDDYGIAGGTTPIALFITGTRNCGKSTGTWNVALKESLREDAKCVYLRNKDITTKNFKGEFNSRYKNQFSMSDFHIHKLEKDEKGKFVKTDLVGYVAAINCYERAKSLQYDNVNMIIYDEFNTKDLIMDVYGKFINLITSFIRMNPNILMVCLANRDDENNEFSVNLGTDDYRPTYEDQVIWVNEDDEETKNYIKIYWVELGTKGNDLVHLKKSLFYGLAKYDTNSYNYLEGEYAVPKPRMVLNYRMKIKDTYRVMGGFYYKQQLYYYGKFIYQDTVKFAICTSHNVRQDFSGKIKIYYFDTNSSYMELGIKLDDETIIELVELIIMQIKKGDLFFDSFNMKQIFDLIM